MRKEGGTMAKQKKYAEIHTVTFQYIGTDKEFNFFLKSIVYDYLTFINSKKRKFKNFSSSNRFVTILVICLV